MNIEDALAEALNIFLDNFPKIRMRQLLRIQAIIDQKLAEMRDKNGFRTTDENV